MNTFSPLPKSPAKYSHSTPAFCTSHGNTRRPCSSAREDQPKRRVECNAAVQVAPDAGSGEFAEDPSPCLYQYSCAKGKHAAYVFPSAYPRVKIKIRSQEVPKRPSPLWTLILPCQHNVNAHQPLNTHVVVIPPFGGSFII